MYEEVVFRRKHVYVYARDSGFEVEQMTAVDSQDH